MKEITVSELLAQYGLSWCALYKRGAGTKSMCHDWARGKHLPSVRSTVRIARAIGLPSAYVLGILRTRNQWENSPRMEWGANVRKALQDSSTFPLNTDRIEPDGPGCPSCGQRVPKAA